MTAGTDVRAARHAALGDPARLAIVDLLWMSDRSPSALGARLALGSNLLAHHLDVLEAVGLIERRRSSGDGRRRYVHLLRSRLSGLTPRAIGDAPPALFVCTANAARSPLAAALWRHETGAPATSAGTHPASAVHPRAARAAHRAGLDLADDVPRAIDALDRLPPLVVTVCDRAHEEIADPSWVHWSVPDPASLDTDAAFDRTIEELRERISDLRDPAGAR